MLTINNYKNNFISLNGKKNQKPSEEVLPYYDVEWAKELKEGGQSRIIANNIFNKTWASVHKLANSFTTYPAKGLSGHKDSNFYEFLSMGAVPYVIGSAALITVFNAASKFFSPSSAKAANRIGKKLGVGVVFYALGKMIGQKTVNEPIRFLTGIDLDRPYVKKVQGLIPGANKDAKTYTEYHKVFESADFPRWDLLHEQGYGREDGNRNYFFDKIAKRNGFGKLESSDQEMKPRIKNLIIDGRKWKMITGYLWAITGVALASQTPWEEVFVNKGINRTFNGTLKTFGKRVKDSFVEMWKGGAKKSMASGLAGKALVVGSLASTVIGTAISVSKFNSKVKPSNVINNSQKVYEF